MFGSTFWGRNAQFENQNPNILRLVKVLDAVGLFGIVI